MIKVKICGMKDPGNVKAVADLGPDYLGFIFYSRSQRFVGEKPDISLFQNVSSKIEKVGVFVNEDETSVINIANASGIRTIQLHGNESISYCEFLKSSGLTIIKAFSIDNSFSFDELNPFLNTVDYLLFDTKDENHGGSGRKFNWNKLSEYKGDKPFFLSGGIGPEDSEVIKSLQFDRLHAIDINSLFELNPGIKNTTKVESFLNSLKTGRL